MINLVISPSQQRGLACLMGDSEQNHMFPIGEKLYEILSTDERLNVYLIPKLIENDTANLIRSVELSNEFILNNGLTGYHLSLHSDGGNYATGASGLYISEAGKNFISPIFDQISNLTPWQDIGLRLRNDLYELTQTIAYAGILEVSFHDIPEEAAWIHENTDIIAETIAKGVYEAFGLSMPTNPGTSELYWKQKYDSLLSDLQALINKQ